ncbi:O-antigen ligase family protein [Flavobacterium sp.]|jgi:hypothetical protein|uniref:O-antigen ligase family protein n=1 Tax=Flavobacterium sp. TaxID=239 RepID=UPI0037BFA270
MQQFSSINLRSFFLALVPVFGIYLVLPGFTLDIIILLILFISDLLFKRKIVFNYKIILLFSVLFFCNFFSFIFSRTSIQSIFINNSIQMIFFAVLLCYFIQQEVNSVFIKTLHILGVFASVFVLFQFVAFWVFNQSITLFLPLNTSVEDLDLLISISYGRPNSIFLEPAHFAIFILPLLYNSLVEKKYSLTAIYLLGLIFSTSTTGFAILIVILVYHFVFQMRNLKFLLLLAVLSVPFFFLSDFYDLLFSSNLDKLGADSIEDNNRLFGNFPLIFKMDIFNWFFGLGHNQMSNFFSNYGIFVGNYSNSYLMIFFSFGLIGFLSLIIYVVDLYKLNINKGYFIVFLLVLLSDQILFNRNFFYLVSCIYFIRNTNLDASTNQYSLKVFTREDDLQA